MCLSSDRRTIRVADSIPVGESVQVSILAEPFVVFHVRDGEYYAIQNPCVACFSPSTFCGQPVDLETLTVKCAKGGHAVSLKDGSMLEGGLGQISAKAFAVEGDGVYVEVPEALADWAQWTLADRRNVAKDVDAFVFDVPKGIRREEMLRGDGIVHVSSKIVVDGISSCVRDYTPTRLLPGNRVEILVKNYPVHGIMSKHYHSLKIGDQLVHRVNPKMTFNLSKLTGEGKLKKLVMVGAGSGITPMHQVLSSKAVEKIDKVLVMGFFRDEKDIIEFPGSEIPANVKIQTCITQPTGCPTALKQCLDDESLPKGDGSKSMYIVWSGPRGFNSTIDRELESRNFHGFDEDCLVELPN
ncbi:flavohemoprotein b5/b5r, putative [Perkinsus marinus ATCC 50983]|uniref:Flavohemoprotein b5/b5r, putative n=1 Tax=Perkinsus marinus (strain ATCC 50983 / TXsc) TaxID=423536 RepID=C5KYD9_PERM5|nr:flavohemoprotein b5/b5r, putative [Perkinsus marinus ATCC 50983]EER10516.1 flavohemoprotein b5/b5r, putative [Perkinsus marinus ATCC 50983]|eukprot:XP_002778721.1 flavohemoprotein b5/b5r, putative [Perkinsus marinus ATCC 50983]